MTSLTRRLVLLLLCAFLFVTTACTRKPAPRDAALPSTQKTSSSPEQETPEVVAPTPRIAPDWASAHDEIDLWRRRGNSVVVVRATPDTITVEGEEFMTCEKGQVSAAQRDAFTGDFVNTFKALPVVNTQEERRLIDVFLLFDGDMPATLFTPMLVALQAEDVFGVRAVVSRSDGQTTAFKVGLDRIAPSQPDVPRVSVSLDEDGITLSHGTLDKLDKFEVFDKGSNEEPAPRTSFTIKIPLKPGHTLEAALAQFASATTPPQRALAIHDISAAYDMRALYMHLVKVHDTYPDMEVISLFMPDHYPVELLAELSDVSRAMREGASDGTFPDDDAFLRAHVPAKKFSDACPHGCLFPFAHAYILPK